jgi:phage tail P2-like protein
VAEAAEVFGADLAPPNASALERVLADLDWNRLSWVDFEVVRRVVDPATCPVELLPWLAWSLSVDAWDSDWPEATKRAVIAASPEVHRYKGTRRAVRLALEALGVETDIVVWHEEDPPARRGTFKVIAWVTGTGPVLDVALLTRLRQSVRAAKKKTAVFTLRLGSRSSGLAFAGGVTTGVASIACFAEPAPVDGLFAAGEALQIARLTIQPEAA